MSIRSCDQIDRNRQQGLIERAVAFVTVVFVIGSLSACQYLQPRSVDDIERGQLPAPIERADTRDGVLIQDSGPAGASLMDEEAMRLAKQREQAAKTAMLVLSVGMTRGSGLQSGSALTLAFEAEKTGEKRELTVALDCEARLCGETKLKLKAFEVVARDLPAIAELPEGRWKLHSARLLEVSALADGERTTVKFANAPGFEVRNGHTTYLGSFTVIGGAQRIVRGNGKEIVRLPMVRHSNLSRDMERALVEFPETRGRQMLNEARNLATPETVN